jgi:hypothetical protein
MMISINHNELQDQSIKTIIFLIFLRILLKMIEQYLELYHYCAVSLGVV